MNDMSTLEDHFTSTEALQTRAKELLASGYVVLEATNDGVWVGYSCFRTDSMDYCSNYLLEMAGGALPEGDPKVIYSQEYESPGMLR